MTKTKEKIKYNIREELKMLLKEKTSCTIQHNGWACGTCFFAISKKLNNKDWQAILFIRGDYKREELDNLPQSLNRSINKIINVCK